MTRVRMVGESPSMLDSWLMWRELSRQRGGVSLYFESIGYKFPDHFYVFLKKSGYSICPFCDGWGEATDKLYGRAYCLCSVLDWQADLKRRSEPYESYVAPANLLDMNTFSGVEAQQEEMANVISYVTDWMLWPNKWIVLWGGVGGGKSTILASIRNELPIAMYVTAYDFEQQMYRGLTDGTFDEYLELLGQVPILLFDDWGAEYGKPLVHSKASAVIDKRDRVWRDLITVVATNLALADFKSYNRRMGSRLRDKEKVEVLSLLQIDHRTGR